MARPPNKSGTSKTILMLGTIAAGVLVGGVLYQSTNSSDQDDMELMGIVEQQPVVEAVIERPAVPEAVIPTPVATPAAEPAAQKKTVMKPPQLPSLDNSCLLYTSPSPRDRQKSRMPSSA